MMRHHLARALGAATLVAASAASAQTRYVQEGAMGVGDCTARQPCGSIQHAIEFGGAVDRIEIRRGTYAGFFCTAEIASRRPALDIYAAEGLGSVTISSPADAAPTLMGRQALAQVFNADGWRVRGVRFDGRMNNVTGISVFDSRNIEIIGNEVRGTHGGILVAGTGDTLTVLGNKVYGVTEFGIGVAGTEASTPIGVRYPLRTVNVSANLVDGVLPSMDNVIPPTGIAVTGVDGANVVNNGVVELSGIGLLIGGLDAAFGTKNVDVFHNTVLLSLRSVSESSVVRIGSSTQQLDLRNNVFLRQGNAFVYSIAAPGFDPPTDSVFDFNAYTDGDPAARDFAQFTFDGTVTVRSYAEWAMSGREVSSTRADNNALVDLTTLRLAMGSRAIDSGDVTILIRFDHEGTPRFPGRPDMGRDELGPAPTDAGVDGGTVGDGGEGPDTGAAGDAAADSGSTADGGGSGMDAATDGRGPTVPSELGVHGGACNCATPGAPASPTMVLAGLAGAVLLARRRRR